MNPPLPPLDVVLARLARLPAAAAADLARADQQARWAAGEQTLAEQYLARLRHVATNPADALVLVYGEVLLRTELGQAVDPDAVSARFPQYRDALGPLFEVHRGLALAPAAPPPPACIPEAPPAIPGYDRLRPAARGGMGVVYHARSVASGHEVAVKLVRTAAGGGTEELIRFLQEADILARLSHPNVVRFLDSGVADAGPYLVTEWVPGGSLADSPGRGPADPGWVVELARGVARGLGAAHAIGVIHRDVKPGNVLLGGSGRPRVTDFGLGRLTGCGGTLTTTGEVLGTRRYMPPEQLDGRAKEVGPWSDLFSLGAVLYELLTGRPAFPERDTTAGLAGFTDPLPPRLLAPGIPPRLEAVCLKALRPAPADRYRTAAEFAADLGPA